MPQSSATHATSEADLWVLSWSAMNTHFASGSVDTVARICATKSSSVRVSPRVGQITLPVPLQNWLLGFVCHAACIQTRATPACLWTWHGRLYPFQCLNARLFINADHMHARLMELLGLVIKLTHVSHFLPKVASFSTLWFSQYLIRWGFKSP